MIFLLQLLIVGMSSVARGRLVTEFLPSFTVWPCWPSELSKRKPIKSNDLGNSMAIMCRSVWWCECRLLAFDYRVFYRVFFFFTVGRWPRWPSVPFARPCVTPHGHCPSWLVGLAPFVLHSVSPFRFPFLSVGRPRRPINEREHPLPPTPPRPTPSRNSRVASSRAIDGVDDPSTEPAPRRRRLVDAIALAIKKKKKNFHSTSESEHSLRNCKPIFDPSVEVAQFNKKKGKKPGTSRFLIKERARL